ncbi:MAG: RdgB/HAM1 family non-canonical purine NTP pyrophosphatase [Tissierellia bacterium]|nr:RdgB/HAM1 family non-canonical purine NTP pyrophosphatase [Tissierellia bacterium]
MKKLIISSDNTHKVQEIKDILKDLPYEVLTKSQAGFGHVEVVEDGQSLEENAKKKVQGIQADQALVIGDDTGLFVQALDGAPGIYSARYAGEEATDLDNRKKLLEEMEGKEDRQAYFKTVIALAHEGEIHYLSGVCPGQITQEEKGQGGFGYDPIFLPEGEEETFASMSEERKNQISHRALALEALKNFLEDK